MTVAALKKAVRSLKHKAMCPQKKAGAKVIKHLTKARAPYVRQKAGMTPAQWKALQVGMDARWPQPTYMRQDHGRGHNCYRDETYMTITRWTADTQIRYRPHAKAPGSKSHIRYEKYSKARTVQEALKLGSWPADWCWDYERGFIRVVGGRVRAEPIDSSEVDLSTLGEVHRILARWFIREAAKILGISLRDLDSDAKDQLLLRMKRTIAEAAAQEILAERRKITEGDVLKVLQGWGFRKNLTRLNVLPEGDTFVFSDTMGLVSDRTGNIIATKYTLAYPSVQKVLTGYLRESLPKKLGGFTFTSINVNKNYAGRRHRDGNNVGPSIIKAFGAFKGGKLRYYPNDDRSRPVEDLPSSDQVELDLKKNMLLFDGRRGHEVEAFRGERYTLVYFTAPRADRAAAKTKKGLKECGFLFPAGSKDTRKSLSLLAAPRGYGSGAGRASGPQFITWPGRA